MTLRHMNIFVSVYQNRSITKAAGQLHLAQPSVSLAIRELENYYGVCLFDRISRRIYPTECGHRFYEYALHIVSLFQKMEAGISGWEDSAALRIGSSITIGNFLLPSVIKEFKRSHPDLPVRVTIKNTETIEQYVVDNEVDFALVEGDISHPELRKEIFFSDRMCLVAAPSHPLAACKIVTLEALAGCDLLLREPGSAGRELAEILFSSHGLQISPAWESISTQALVRAAANGLGIAILPHLLVREDLKDGTVIEIPIHSQELSRSFYLIRHPNKYLTQPAQEFLALCRSWQVSE